MTTDTPAAISFPVAESNGSLVWAAELAAVGDRRNKLTCIGCASRLVFRAGQRNTAHFAHFSGDGCTNPESALHRTAKRVIADAITAQRAAKEGYRVLWECPTCGESRRANLATERVHNVVLEKQFGSVQPDISLLDVDGALRVAVEVVVTHEPEPEALAWFAANDVGVLTVTPTWEGLPDLRDGFEAPTTLGMRCTGVRHSEPATTVCHCGEPLTSVRLETAVGPDCWKCHRPTNVVDVIEITEVEVAGRASDPRFAGVEKVAAPMGVRLNDAFSKTESHSYLMHHCACGAKAGDFFCYEDTTDNTIKPGGKILHTTLCAGGHWHVDREAVVPDDAPRRLIGAFTSERHSDDGWTGEARVETGLTTSQMVRRMIGNY